MKILRTFPGILIAAVLIPQLAIIPLIFTSILFFIDNSIKAQFVDNIRNTASLLASNISHINVSNDKSTIESLLQEYLFTGQISFAEIEWDNGEIITTYEGNSEHMHHQEDFFFGQHGDKTYNIAIPFSGEAAGNSGIIRIGFDESIIENQLDTVVERTTYAGLALLSSSTIFILGAAGLLTRPIRRLRDSARKISFQKGDITLETNSSIAELNSLGTSLENMRKAFVEQHNQIKAREEYISSIMRNMADPLIIANGLLQVQTLNNAARELFGYSKAEYRNNSLDIIFSTKLIEEIRNNCSTEEKTKLEGVGHTKEKEIIPLELHIGQIKYDGGTLFIINARDIRIRKEAEAALIDAKQYAEDANKQKSYFLSTMSHELRTPMNAIIGYSDLILEDLEQDDDNRSDVLRIKKSATHLLELINSILDLSKIEAGKMELNITHFAIEDLLDEAVATTSQQVQKNNNTLKLKIEKENQTLNSDYLKLKQIVINLISNATKFTKNGEIFMTVYPREEEDKKYLCIDVQDTGIGIPADKLDTLFKSFTQADSSVTRKYGGTGLGLAISKRLADMLDGDIEVESSEGVGSKFHLYVSMELGESTSVFI